MKKLKTYLMRYWYLYLFSMVCMVSAIALDMITPQITRHIIDDVIVGGQAELLMRFLFGLLGIGGTRHFTVCKRIYVGLCRGNDWK